MSDICRVDSSVNVESSATDDLNIKNNQEPSTLSKRALKRLKKKEKWLQYKPIKRFLFSIFIIVPSSFTSII